MVYQMFSLGETHGRKRHFQNKDDDDDDDHWHIQVYELLIIIDQK